MEEDPTLPIDFDGTSNFSRFLEQPLKNGANDSTFQGERTMNQSASESIIERPASRGTTMREQDNMISELKKECFGLKMRIYYMEEKLHATYDTPTGDILKQNIEYKVTIEELKQDLQSKSSLLADASKAMEQLTSASEMNHQNNSNSEVEEVRKCLADITIGYEELKTRKTNDENSLKAMIKELEETLQEKEKCIEEMKKNSTQMQEDISGKSNITKDLEGQVQTYQEKVKTLQSNLADKTKKLSTVEKTLKEIKEEKLNLNKERLQFELDSLKNKDSKIIELETHLKEEIYHKNKLITQLKENSKQLNAQKQEIESMTGKLEDLQQKLEQNDHKHVEDRKKIKRGFAEGLARAKVDSGQLEMSSQQQVSELQTVVEQLNKEKADVQALNEKNLRELQDLYESLMKSHEKKTSGQQDLIEKNKDLTEKLNTKDQELQDSMKLHQASVEEKHNVLENLNQQFLNAQQQFQIVTDQLVEVKKKSDDDQTIIENLLKKVEKFKNEKESVFDKLNALHELTEEEKNKYSQLYQKLVNNKHPQSQLRILEREYEEFGVLREKLIELFKDDLPPHIQFLDIIDGRQKHEKHRQMLEAMLLSKDKDVLALKDNFSALEFERKELTDQLSKMSEINKQLKDNQSTPELVEKSSALLKEKDQLKNDLREVCNINKRLRNKLKESSQKNDNRDVKIEKLTEEVNQQKNKNANFQAEILTLKKSAANRAKSKENENNEIVELRKTHSLLLTENATLKKQVKVQGGENEKALEENVRLLAMNSKDVRVITEELLKLKEELAGDNSDMFNSSTPSSPRDFDFNREIEKLRKVKASLEFHFRELNKTNSSMKERLSITEEKKCEKETKIGLLSRQLVELEGQLESFSPIHTGSQQNIANSNQASTQTIPQKEDNTIALHIEEMRKLRKQLEATIENNNMLKLQLEERLSDIEKDALQVTDPHTSVFVVRENDALRLKLQDCQTSIAKHLQTIRTLNEEKKSLKDEGDTLRSQLQDLNDMTNRLKLEMETYDRLVEKAGFKNNQDCSNDSDIMLLLLEEIRELREQLKISAKLNSELQSKLSDTLERSSDHIIVDKTCFSPEEPTSAIARRSLFSSKESLLSNKSNRGSPHETPTKDNDTSEPHPDNPDDELVSIQLHEWNKLRMISKALLNLCTKLYVKLKSNPALKEACRHLVSMDGYINDISKILSEPQKHPNGEVSNLRNEVERLTNILTSKEKFIKSSLDMIESNIVWKESMDQSLTNKLKKARNTLKATKGNLQTRTSRSSDSGGSVSKD